MWKCCKNARFCKKAAHCVSGGCCCSPQHSKKLQKIAIISSRAPHTPTTLFRGKTGPRRGCVLNRVCPANRVDGLKKSRCLKITGAPRPGPFYYFKDFFYSAFAIAVAKKTRGLHLREAGALGAHPPAPSGSVATLKRTLGPTTGEANFSMRILPRKHRKRQTPQTSQNVSNVSKRLKKRKKVAKFETFETF